MKELKRIGLFTRDTEQEYPKEKIDRLFRRVQIELLEEIAEVPSESLDMIIALGGDGTVLRALSLHPGVPVLAINYGNVGFLTQSDREDLDKVLVRLLSDDYEIEDRLALWVTHRGEHYRCVNEVVVKAMTRMIQVSVEINGHPVQLFRGDGVIVGTPTGSTAYLMSAGAPLVTPDVDCIILKALNEYSIRSQAFVLPGSAQVELKINFQRVRRGDVQFIADGVPHCNIRSGEQISICRSQIPARLVRFEPDYFFRNLRERLHW